MRIIKTSQSRPKLDPRRRSTCADLVKSSSAFRANLRRFDRLRIDLAVSRASDPCQFQVATSLRACWSKSRTWSTSRDGLESAT